MRGLKNGDLQDPEEGLRTVISNINCRFRLTDEVRRKRFTSNSNERRSPSTTLSNQTHSRSTSPDLEADFKIHEQGHKHSAIKRERSKSPQKFPGAVDIARLHPNKVLLQALLDVPQPEYADPEHQKKFVTYHETLFTTFKRYHQVKTGWDQLQQEWATIEPTEHGTQNTNYRNTEVDLKNLKPWDDFPTHKEIHNFSKSTPLLEKNFHKIELPVVGGDQCWYQRWFDGSTIAPVLAEINVVEIMSPFFLQLNALIRLATYERGKESSWVVIGGGKLAMKRRIGGTPNKKDPDRVAFWTDGRHARTNSIEQGKPRTATEIPCLLVGDFKMAGKFNHNMLVKVCVRETRAEPRKVMNQIHDYMDMHNNRFGYIITETELVVFRRRAKREMWGHVDFSPSIPIQAPEGKLNALMVLWYFHVKYAVLNQDEGYILPSYYHNCPIKYGGGRCGEIEPVLEPEVFNGPSKTASPARRKARQNKKSQNSRQSWT